MALYTLAYLFSFPFILIASLFSKKLRDGLTGRRGLYKRLEKISHTLPVYWFHIASSGELEQALPILDELKARTACTVFLSYFSPTARAAIALEKKRRALFGKSVPWDFADYSPHDLPWSAGRYIRLVRPKAFTIIHRELWPNLITQLHKQEIPIYLFATYWPEATRKTFTRYKRWAECIKFIGTVDSQSDTFVRSVLPAARVEVLGDPRIDRVFQRQALSKGDPPWAAFLNKKKNIILASVWEKDLQCLLPLIQWVMRHDSEWRIILVPHESSQKSNASLKKSMKAYNPETRLWSQWSQVPDDHSHLIIDKVGILAELYQISKFVFVGGSFKGRVHNVLEPAVYGNPILTGPFIWNSAEACEMRDLSVGLKVAHEGESILRLAKAWMENEGALKLASASVKEYLENRRGAAARYAGVLLKAD